MVVRIEGKEGTALIVESKVKGGQLFRGQEDFPRYLPSLSRDIARVHPSRKRRQRGPAKVSLNLPCNPLGTIRCVVPQQAPRYRGLIDIIEPPVPTYWRVK